jgi:xanthine dehydrogenase YagS FAD-binding subunit
MNAFRYERPADATGARALHGSHARYIAGGTNLLDLMKDDVESPDLIIDISRLPYAAIESTEGGVRVGALARMSDVADDIAIASRFPSVAEALLAGASPQLRNMATIGGNILQRTRCTYFRDPSQACNKREPDSGCSALGGVNRMHAVIGASDDCIATNPSDLAVALTAVDAIVHVQGHGGAERAIPIADFYVLPGTTPWRENVLEAGDLIVAVELPASGFAHNSTYLKIRDRASYEFALVSVGVGLERVDGIVREARIVLGGVAPRPWRAERAEALIVGTSGDASAMAAAAAAAIDGMRGYGENDFKIELVQRAVVRALQTVAA